MVPERIGWPKVPGTKYLKNIPDPVAPLVLPKAEADIKEPVLVTVKPIWAEPVSPAEELKAKEALTLITSFWDG
jgi:hypothetical protein